MSLQIRPRFKERLRLTPEEILTRLKERLNRPDCPCVGVAIPGYAQLKIPVKDRHFWSPQLTLTFQVEEDEPGTVVRGLYGPNPTVWAAFAFGYSAIGVMAFFASILGFSDWSLKKDPTWLYTLPGFALGAIILYLAAQAGQRIGADQMHQLKYFFDETLGDEVILLDET